MLTERNNFLADLAQRGLLLAVIGALLFLFGTRDVLAQSVGADGADASDAEAPLCRMGVNANHYYFEPGIAEFDTAPLRIGWYIDYTARQNAPQPQGMHFTPVIRLVQEGDDYNTGPSGTRLDDAIRNYAGRGTAWVIGNEPDRPGIYQDDIEPEVYAKAYHELRARIKAIDPTARVLAGSIVQATEVRMQYLDLILAAHQARYGTPMEVDGWAIHGFILNEVSCANRPDGLDCWGAEIPPGVDEATGLIISPQDNDDLAIFQQNIVRMRQWMADNGYRNVPLYLSEYGVLMPDNYGPDSNGDGVGDWNFSPPFDPDRVNAFMTSTFDFIYEQGVDDQIGYPLDGNRLVQYLSWYSTSGKYEYTDRPGEFNGFLFDPERGYNISPMGENYRDYAAQVTYDHDFQPLGLSIESPFFVLGDRALIVIGVDVANAGHNLYPVNAPIRLYQGPAADDQVLNNGVAQVSGCGERDLARITIEVPWNDGPPPSINVTAVVNPDSSVEEVNAGNNRINATLQLEDVPYVTPVGSIFMPLFRR